MMLIKFENMTYLNEDGSSFLYSAKREHSLMSMRSTHRRTSGPSSTSALKTAILDMRTAAASWSKDCAMAGSPEGPLRLRATVVTLRWNWPDECW